jgi:hypothetical protein
LPNLAHRRFGPPITSPGITPTSFATDRDGDDGAAPVFPADEAIVRETAGFAAAKNSPKMGTGVKRRRGRCPLHGFNHGFLDSRSPTGDEDAALGALPPTFGGGDADLARSSDLHREEQPLTFVDVERVHALDSTVGNPIFVQKSSATSALDKSGEHAIGDTSGSSPSPSHATSSATSRVASTVSSSSSRKTKRDPPTRRSGEVGTTGVGGAVSAAVTRSLSVIRRSTYREYVLSTRVLVDMKHAAPQALVPVSTKDSNDIPMYRACAFPKYYINNITSGMVNLCFFSLDIWALRSLFAPLL